MSDTPEPQNPVQHPAAPAPEIKQHEASSESARAETESHATGIRDAARSATEARNAVERAREEMDQQLHRANDAVTALRQQVEAARASAEELRDLTAGIRASSAQSVELSVQASAAVESVKQLASTASEAIGRIEGIRDDAVKTQALIAEKNEHIEGGLKHVARVRRDMEAALEQAASTAEAAERQLHASKASAEAIATFQLGIQTTKDKADNDAAAIATSRKDAEAHAQTIRTLADVAEATEGRVKQYEAQLELLIQQSQDQRKQIDELLAGATDAGLASAFDRRSKKFRRPEIAWQCAFVLSLLGLVGIAVWQAVALQTLDQLPDWQQVARMLAIKVPFAAPLVWLAIHSARQASLAKRLEEEYAFKATISMSFDGYRRQMAEVGRDLAPDSPLASLCNNTLREIADSPGRVYDGQRMDPNIATSLGEVLKPSVEAGFRTLSSKLPDLKS